MSLICKEDLLKDIEDTVLFSGRADHVSAEIRGANKVVDRIKVAPEISNSPEKSCVCPHCGKKL